MDNNSEKIDGGVRLTAYFFYFLILIAAFLLGQFGPIFWPYESKLEAKFFPIVRVEIKEDYEPLWTTCTTAWDEGYVSEPHACREPLNFGDLVRQIGDLNPGWEDGFYSIQVPIINEDKLKEINPHY